MSGGYGFTLAVCAEMVFRDQPILERVRHIHDLGFAVEIWDWTAKDLSSLAATGAQFTSMTGYIEGNLTEPDGAEALLRTAEESIAAAAKLGTPNLNLHGTGLGPHGLPVRQSTPSRAPCGWPRRRPSPASPPSASVRASCSAWKTSTLPSTIPARRSPGPRTLALSSRPSAVLTCG
jgi:hypothetical protein